MWAEPDTNSAGVWAAPERAPMDSDPADTLAHAELAAIAVSRIRRHLTPDQADSLTGLAVGDRTPTITTATLAEDMTTRAPLFAYLPLGGDMVALHREYLTRYADDPEAYAHLADDLERSITAALAAADASPEWDALTATTWWPSEFRTTDGASDYHRALAAHSTRWVAVVVVRDGVRGGYLDIPEYHVTVASEDGWITLMPGWLMHGVSTTRNVRRGAYRHAHTLISGPDVECTGR